MEKNMEKNMGNDAKTWETMQNYGKLWNTTCWSLIIEGLLYTYGIAEFVGDYCDNLLIHTRQPTS